MSDSIIIDWHQQNVQAMLRLESTLELGRFLANNLDDMFDWDAFFISEQVSNSRLFRLVYYNDLIDGKRKGFPGEPGKESDYDVLPELAQGEPLLINRENPEIEPVRLKNGKPLIRFGDEARRSASLLFAPVMIQGELQSIISIQSYTPNQYSDVERDELLLLARLIAPVVQRIRIKAELAQTIDRYRQAIAQASAVPYERDYSTGRIAYMGDGIVEMTGYAADELTPDIWKHVIQEIVLLGEAEGLTRDEALRRSHMGKLNQWRAEYRLRHRDGGERWISDTSINLFNEARECYGSLGIMQDITARKRAAQLREELSRVGRQLSSSATRKEAADAVAEAADRLLGWDACFITLFDGKTGKAIPLLSADQEGGVRREYPEYYGRPINPGPNFLRTITDGQFLIPSRELVQLPGLKSFGESERQSQSLMYAAIRDAGQPIGVFSIQSYTPWRYTEDSLNTLQLLADYCGAAITRAGAIEMMKERDTRYRRAIAQANAVSYEHDVIANSYAYMGDGIEALTGYTAAEMTPELWASLVQEVIPLGGPETHTRDESGRVVCTGRGNNWRADYRIRTRSGETRWVSDSSISVRDPRGEDLSYIGLLIDITERRRMMEINEELSALGRDISEAHSLYEAARHVAFTADRLIGWDACFVTFCDLQAGTTQNILLIDEVDGERRDVTPPVIETEPIGKVSRRTLEEGPQLILLGDEQSASHPGLLNFGDSERHSESLIFVPIKRAGRDPIGVLSVQSYRKNAYVPDDVKMLESLADHCAAAIERIMSEEKLLAGEKQSALMAALANRLNSSRSAQDAAAIIADVTAELLKWDAFNLDLYDPDEDVTIDVLNYDTIEGVKTVFRPTSQSSRPSSFGRRALVEGGFLLLRDSSSAAAANGDASVPFGNVHRRSASLMFVPIRFSKKNVGILSIQSYTPKAYTQASLATLQTLADYCGGALERIRAEDALARERRRLAVFAETSRNLSAAATAKDAARMVLHAADELIGWDCCFLVLFDPEEHCFRPLVGYDEFDGERRETIKAGTTWNFDAPNNTTKAFRDGKIMILREPAPEGKVPAERPYGNMTRRSESLMFVPARRGDQVIGVLSIQSYSTNAYTADDLETLQELADHCISALERAFAEDKLRASEKRSETFARLGRQLNVASSPLEAGRNIAKLAEELFNWDACFIDLYIPKEHGSYHILNIDTIDGVKTECPQTHSGRHMTPMKEKMLHEGAQLILREEDEQTKGGVATHSFGQTGRRSMSLMYAPARKGDKVVGFISLQSYTPNAFTQGDLETLQALADHCGGALERIRTEAALAEERRHISAMADLGRHLSAASSPEEAARQVLDTARGLIGWDSAFLALCRNSLNEVTPIVSFDQVDGVLKEVSGDFPDGPINPDGYIYKAIHEGAQILLRQGETSGQYIGRRFGDVARLSASLLYAPVRRGADVIGIVSIQSYSPNAYSHEDLSTLQTLADHCAGALERIEAERALIDERHQLRTLIDNLPDSIYFKDREGRFQINNKGHLEYLKHVSGRDIRSTADVQGKTDYDFFPEEMAAAFLAEECLIMETGEAVFNREESHDGDDTVKWMSATKVPLRTDDGTVTGIVGITRDITDYKQAQAQLQRAAFHDALTGLPNRALFMDRLSHSLALNRRRADFKFALLFMDLDKFKDVNDKMGHLMGDELLKKVGERLKLNVRETDTVARLGGDEFTILLNDFQDFDQARQVAERLLADLSRPVVIGEHTIPTNASIGVTFSSRGYTDIEDILRDADEALYQAKEQGRGRFVVFGE